MIAKGCQKLEDKLKESIAFLTMNSPKDHIMMVDWVIVGWEIEHIIINLYF